MKKVLNSVLDFAMMVAIVAFFAGEKIILVYFILRSSFAEMSSVLRRSIDEDILEVIDNE